MLWQAFMKYTLPFAIPILATILKNFDFEIIDCNINNYSENEVAEIIK